MGLLTTSSDLTLHDLLSSGRFKPKCGSTGKFQSWDLTE